MKRGFEGIVVMSIGLIVATIMLASVIQPVINSQFALNSNCSQNGPACLNNLTNYQTAQVVANQLPTLNMVALLVMVAGAVLGVFAMATR